MTLLSSTTVQTFAGLVSIVILFVEVINKSIVYTIKIIIFIHIGMKKLLFLRKK